MNRTSEGIALFKPRFVLYIMAAEPQPPDRGLGRAVLYLSIYLSEWGYRLSSESTINPHTPVAVHQ